MASLLQFSVGGYRSFLDTKTLSMSPASIQDTPIESVVARGKHKFLTSIALYGANSSGKSNIVSAIATMKRMVLDSVKLNDHDELAYDPFLLSDASQDAPTHFEVVYLDGSSTRMRYGFNYNLHAIEREWLFVSINGKKENPLFVRDEDGIAVNNTDFTEGIGLEERTNDNRLFLSLVAQLGGKTSKAVMDFFAMELNVISGLSNTAYQGITERQFLNKTEEARQALEFFKTLQLGFDDIEAIQGDDARNGIDVYTVHNVYDSDGAIVRRQRMRLASCESQGTLKLYDLAGPLFKALNNGQLLVIDELDAKMHPLISQHIIKLFNSRKSNPKHAQLIFTTHDTNLLSSHLLRRDQIWFTEKDNIESTDLYNLMHIVLPDGTKPRGDGNLERNYIKGRYGAVPYLTSLDD